MPRCTEERGRGQKAPRVSVSALHWSHVTKYSFYTGVYSKSRKRTQNLNKYLNFREYSWVWAYTSVTARCKMLLRHRRVQSLMNLMYDGLLIGSGYSICLGTRADTMQHRWCDGTEWLIQPPDPHRHICYVEIWLWPNSSKMYKSTWWLHKSISYLVTQLLCVFSCTLDTQWSAAEAFLI